MEEEKPTPGPKEYVKIKGVWQHTNTAWWVDKARMNDPIPGQPETPGPIQYDQFVVENHGCVAHVHHWKTELEEYCRVDEEWKCVRCGDVVPPNIQSMIKLYRPLKDVHL